MLLLITIFFKYMCNSPAQSTGILKNDSTPCSSVKSWIGIGPMLNLILYYINTVYSMNICPKISLKLQKHTKHSSCNFLLLYRNV